MFWQEWVLGYDLDRQLTLAFRMEQSRRNVGLGWLRQAWQRAAEAGQRARQISADRLTTAGLLLGLVLAAVFLWPRLRTRLSEQARLERLKQGRPSSSDAELAYRQMLDRLRRRGLEKPASSTPAEFARSLGSQPLAPLVGEFTEVYNGLRFGSRMQQSARLAELLAAIERAG